LKEEEQELVMLEQVSDESVGLDATYDAYLQFPSISLTNVINQG